MDLMNPYARQLTAAEIASGAHRDAVGGLWDEMGRLQCEFLINKGLRPEHRLIDVGCGSLRGGIHFIRYLAAGNYYGLDVNASLIEAGRCEVQAAGLADRQINLLIDDRFGLDRFNATFDYGIAQSVFTHLCLNHIICCLAQVQRVLAPHGRFFATYFEAPHAAQLGTVVHSPGGIRSQYVGDPYHYGFEEMSVAAQLAALAVERIGDWEHPRAQKMLSFTHPQ
jgi:SAM-dependent methyltransferase